ncbi:MAG: hypothetical protein K0S27_1311 [Gammaproteobacteria bacterium]|jgi:ElaB/YqjD/DUF883 family membrane-anchored ribosome-binding protein|nr:hypothetical protein [Gammaproteobacteria bacterium]
MRKQTNRKYAHDVDLSSDIARIREAFSDTAKDVKDKASEVFSQSIENMKDKSANFKENMGTYVSAKPFQSLLLAMLSGIVIGGTLMNRRERAHSRYRE